jgi:riboflavin kinase/FMN adenylyltransferase
VSGAVAVGVFDGLHLGHRAILERALARAREARGPCVVVSFDPHPDVVLAKTFQPVAPLTPIPEKRARLAALGISRTIVLPFTRELAKLEPETFVAEHLVRPLAPRWLVVGENFALGRGRAGDVPRLRTIGATQGFEVDAAPLCMIGGEAVTSTRIRANLAAGRVDEAARLLGRRYNLVGRVVRGDGIGRTLGFPTANLRLHEEKLIPAHGIYAAWARIGDDTTWRRAAMSIGVRPTFGGQTATLEVFVLDWTGDLYDAELEVEFESWVREERRFDGADALRAAIAADVEEVRRRLVARAEIAAPTGPRA